jgi:hypothetical protein
MAPPSNGFLHDQHSKKRLLSFDAGLNKDQKNQARVPSKGSGHFFNCANGPGGWYLQLELIVFPWFVHWQIDELTKLYVKRVDDACAAKGKEILAG